MNGVEVVLARDAASPRAKAPPLADALQTGFARRRNGVVAGAPMSAYTTQPVGNGVRLFLQIAITGLGLFVRKE